METTINNEHNELLEEFEMEFGDYHDFNISLKVDSCVPDVYGSSMSGVVIKITDAATKTSWEVILDHDMNMFYDVYDCNLESISSASEMWKYMYLNMARY